MVSTPSEPSGKHIVLGDNISLVYQEPEVFSQYYVVYHGQRYAQYYFRKSADFLLERAKYLNSGYFICQGGRIIGGVLIKPNFLSDLFLVPPYNDYNEMISRLLSYLKTISWEDQDILLQEVVDAQVPFFTAQGCVVKAEGFWMIRPTEKMYTTIPDGYEPKSILEGDKDELACLIESSYLANPSVKAVASRDTYARSVDNFIQEYKDKQVLYNSSKAIVSKDTKEIVGVCLNMEFEGYPLVMHLAVRDDHQGLGLGSYLLRNSIDCVSASYPAIRLYVYRDNPAVRLYAKIGFAKNGSLIDMFLKSSTF